MNGDLISRSALLEALKKSREHHAESGRDLSLLCRCENIVKAQPTAYNVDKVVEQIKKEGGTYCINSSCDGDCGLCDYGTSVRNVIELVRAGGVE